MATKMELMELLNTLPVDERPKFNSRTKLGTLEDYVSAYGLDAMEVEGTITRRTEVGGAANIPETMIVGEVVEEITLDDIPEEPAEEPKKKGPRKRRLANEDALAIIAKLATGIKGSALAREYGISNTMVWNIKKGNVYNDVTGIKPDDAS